MYNPQLDAAAMYNPQLDAVAMYNPQLDAVAMYTITIAQQIFIFLYIRHYIFHWNRRRMHLSSNTIRVCCIYRVLLHRNTSSLCTYGQLSSSSYSSSMFHNSSVAPHLPNHGHDVWQKGL